MSYLEMMDICRGLIGRHARIIHSNDRSLIGIEGEIIDETLKTFKIRTKTGNKTIPKNIVTLEISLPSGKVVVQGSALMQRPEERIKKWWQKIRRRMKWKKKSFAQIQTAQFTGT